MVAEAIRAGQPIHELFGLEDEGSRSLATDAGVPLRTVTESVLRRLSGTQTPRGPVAVIDLPESKIPTTGRLLVAWGVSDPGNCGTLTRSAAAFGYGYASGPGSADPWSPKVLRSAAGAHFRTSVGNISGIDQLQGHFLVGAVARGGTAPGVLAPTAAVLIGSEAHGLPAEVVDRCDLLVSLPMPGGTESLNAGVAGSIVAYLGVIRSP